MLSQRQSTLNMQAGEGGPNFTQINKGLLMLAMTLFVTHFKLARQENVRGYEADLAKNIMYYS